MSTYYEILGVQPTDTESQLKIAFRNKIQKWHPDNNPTRLTLANTKTLEILEAWDVLKDPKSRNEYDALLEQKAYRHSSNGMWEEEDPATSRTPPPDPFSYNSAPDNAGGTARAPDYTEQKAGQTSRPQAPPSYHRAPDYTEQKAGQTSRPQAPPSYHREPDYAETAASRTYAAAGSPQSTAPRPQATATTQARNGSAHPIRDVFVSGLLAWIAVALTASLFCGVGLIFIYWTWRCWVAAFHPSEELVGCNTVLTGMVLWPVLIAVIIYFIAHH